MQRATKLVAPVSRSLVHRQFRTTAPAQGVVSTVGFMGITGIMLSGVGPAEAAVNAALPKAE